MCESRNRNKNYTYESVGNKKFEFRSKKFVLKLEIRKGPSYPVFVYTHTHIHGGITWSYKELLSLVF